MGAADSEDAMPHEPTAGACASGQPAPATDDPLEALQERLGVRLRDRALLLRALTHHSWCPATSPRDTYDTLEFLGDALIGAQVVEHIFHAYPTADEGEMTALKSEVVSRRTLAEVGMRLGLMRAIRVDAANLRTFNERSRESLCADVVEALVGAIHLDQGREAAAAFVAREILPLVPAVKARCNNTCCARRARCRATKCSRRAGAATTAPSPSGCTRASGCWRRARVRASRRRGKKRRGRPCAVSCPKRRRGCRQGAYE
jgi:hypothetical protein